MSYDDEDYYLPLEDQRVFGAGIKRKRVPFVSSSAELSTTATASKRKDGERREGSVGDRYLSIVMSSSSSRSSSQNPTSKPIATAERHTSTVPENGDQESTAQETTRSLSTTEATPGISKAAVSSSVTAEPDTEGNAIASPDTIYCDICNLPLSLSPSTSEQEAGASAGTTPPRTHTPHEASIAHQVCLEHSHPPSHLDRSRVGLKYLASYGWDPDSRRGLGATGEGIREPVKGKIKHDTVGLGMRRPGDDEDDCAAKKRRREQREREKAKEREHKALKGLDAKKVRKLEDEKRRQAEKLSDMFYRSEDLDKYLR